MLLLTLTIVIAAALGFARPDTAVAMLTRDSNAGERAAIHVVWEFLYQHRVVTLSLLAAML